MRRAEKEERDKAGRHEGLAEGGPLHEPSWRAAHLRQSAVEEHYRSARAEREEPEREEDVSQQRGTASGAILTQLVRRQLLRIERPETKPRRPVYYTSERFLKLFQLTSLDDLPRSEDLSRQ